MGGCWHIAFPVWSEGLVEWLGDVIFLQERRGIISEPSGCSTNEKGKEVVSTGHVALRCYLQTPTIKPFPARRSGNSLVSGKNGASRNKSKNLQKLVGPLNKKTLKHWDVWNFLEHRNSLWTQWKCAWSSNRIFLHETDLDSAELMPRVRLRWHLWLLWLMLHPCLFLNPHWWWWKGWISPQF